MPKPKQWPDCDELINSLKRSGWQAWFEQGRKEEASGNWTDLINRAVGGNTFRAFHGLAKPPSQVFRAWAHEALIARQYFEWLLEVTSHDQYDLWLSAFVEDLRTTWRAQTGADMPYGPSIKLPSLLAKRACLCPEMPTQQFDRVVWLLHVPLDSYTIEAVRYCVPAFWGARLVGKIPRSVSMSFVRDLGAYHAFQEGIRSLADRAGVPSIALDVLAWDSAH